MSWRTRLSLFVVLPAAALLGGCPKPGSVSLHFNASTLPLGAAPVTRYYVYRGGVRIGMTVTTGFIDAPLQPGSYTYYVTAFNGAESLPSNTFVATVP